MDMIPSSPLVATPQAPSFQAPAPVAPTPTQTDPPQIDNVITSLNQTVGLLAQAMKDPPGTGRGGSKKRKFDQALDSISDEEERKKLTRKQRNKDSAQASRDRKRQKQMMLESSVTLLTNNNQLLQHQLTGQAAENAQLKERLRQAEALLAQHNIATDVLMQPAPSIRTPTVQQPPAQPFGFSKPAADNNPLQAVMQQLTHLTGPAVARPPGAGVLVFAVLFTFAILFNCNFMDAHGLPTAHMPAVPRAVGVRRLLNPTSPLPTATQMHAALNNVQQQADGCSTASAASYDSDVEMSVSDSDGAYG
eukprot:NODE_2487_length_1054_cov_23.685005_g2469_i0.p1 GENE.NODE_2487_length_1054_cov_23.685005_g2469_i0~~NODE_2487_length_1054_cov_23.685005_g2469_i0.p1  ORF type:complete len:347 (-),score=67.07 NODE_2487_length_1054_cov_23.685005_g2469_i0:12-929(-)